MTKKTSVAVLFGGVSPEHEVSRVSASSVIKNIPKDKYEVYPVGITKKGEWYYYFGDTADIESGNWEQSERKTPCLISTNTGHKGLLLLNGDKTELLLLDAVFPVLHGKNGEDGTMQGLFEIAQIPYVGCGTASSAVCMDKALTNCILDSVGIGKARWFATTSYEIKRDPDGIMERAERELSYPVFVKPANTGSSVGISKAKDARQLKEAISKALQHDTKVVFEEAINGIEVECAVLGNEEPVASIVGEITPANEFYDYEAKYVADSVLTIPARIDKETEEKVRRTAVKAFLALGCEGMARVDFFVRKGDGAVLLNEVNTIPGFTSISMYPKLFEAYGIPYPELLDRLICLAISKE